MEELLKKILYTGVGFFSLTTAKIKELVTELVTDQKITEEEGKKLVDDFMDKTKDQRKDFEEQLKSVSSKFMKDVDETSRETITALRKRVEELENQLKSSGSSGEEESINPSAAAGSATTDRSGRIAMEENTLQDEKRAAAGQNAVNKVKDNERVSFSDDVLTPQKKMEAEKQRMQEQQDRPASGRAEEDTQKANLGGDILTPEKKMDEARRQARQEGNHNKE